MVSLEFSIFDASNAADRDAWLHAWRSWPGREVFAHPDYGSLFARKNDRLICAAAQTPNGGVLFPFLLRPLAEEPWAEPGEQLFDLVSPYGYGGAFCWDTTDEEAGAYWSEFETWCKTQGVVSSFVRLSLFPEQVLPFNGNVESNQSNIVRSLDLDPDALWRDYEHKVRKNVNRARQSNLTLELDPTGARLDDFLTIYHATMDRRDAEGSYFFPREFFESIVRNLPGQYMFFHVLDDGRMVSTELALVSVNYVYSFLGGTLPDAFPLRPNDLLKHEIILWTREAGKRAFVFGGGYGGDDGIYRYKKSFAPSGSVPFSVGTKIHDAAAYARLVERRRQWENQNNHDWQLRAGWFPEYRA